jgi:Protein of unknown function (DUF3142)
MNLLPNKQLGLVILIVTIIACSLMLWLNQSIRARVASTTPPEPRQVLDSLPDTILWAWERPERLDFIDTERIGVAYLAKTVSLRDDLINIRPRVQPLILTDGTKVIAVVRIETARDGKTSLSERQIAATAIEIAEVGKVAGVIGVQIDFDAKLSERHFYRQLLFKLREQLPSATALSMTALASWCAGDNWLSGLPVDEVVPMFFRLGIDRAQFASRLQSNKESFRDPCDESAGVSTDEVIAAPQRKRLYIFSPKPWTPNAVNDALETYRR